MSTLPLTPYRVLKDKLLGPVGTLKRDQFERELAQELLALALTPKPPRKPYTRKPRE